ncbi:MAG: glycosyltransferase family 4 protein [Ferruginibacter sp.]
MKKLAIITTHPIQYNAPLFKLLHARAQINIKVFYTWGEAVLEDKFDPGFGKIIKWDIPLLDGYEYEFVENISKKPGSHHFKGIDNPKLNQQIKNWNADAVLIYGWSFKSHLKAMRFFKGIIPILFRGDSNLLQSKRIDKEIIRKLFLTWVYRYVDKALYVGTHNKEYYKSFGLAESQLVFAPHAIENERFFKETESQTIEAINWRQKLNIKLNQIVFLYAGKLDENKNTEMLARVFSEHDLDGSQLVIVGNGKCEESLKNSFSKQKNINFLPFQNQKQMPEIYAMADVFVLPSLSETWGLSINEAMASGKAIIASDTCGAAIDLVKDGINGYTFFSNNYNDLSEKIINILNPLTDLKKMGNASLEIIKDWSYQNDCLAIENILNTTF